MDRHSPDLESHVSGVWRNCHILPVPNTYPCGSSRPYLAPAEQVGLVIDTGTEPGNRQIDNQREGVCGFVPATSFPMADRSMGSVFCKGTFQGLPVAAVSSPATNSFSFIGAARVLLVPKGSRS